MSLAMTDEDIDGFVNTAKDVIEGILEEQSYSYFRQRGFRVWKGLNGILTVFHAP